MRVEKEAHQRTAPGEGGRKTGQRIRGVRDGLPSEPQNQMGAERDGSKWAMLKISLCPRNHLFQWIWISPQVI